jgi:hypothetical protein
MLPRLGTLWAPTGLAEWDIATVQLFNRGDDSVNSRFLLPHPPYSHSERMEKAVKPTRKQGETGGMDHQ